MLMRHCKFALLCLLAAEAGAFAPPFSSVSVTSLARTKTALFAEGETDSSSSATTVTSARKEIGYDEQAGRFFETNIDPEDCIPDEEYCIVDKETGNYIRLTLEEKERIFMDALQSYYVSGRQLLNDAEFDMLKEDLAWQGSSLVNMNRQETKYLAAVQAYLKGEPIVSDEEFDALKTELMESKSAFASSKEPKCYIDSGICTVTFEDDKFRNNLLYLPAGAILGILWLGLGFEVLGPLVRLNPLILAALGSPLVINGSKYITDTFIFQDNQIGYGPCPSCGTEMRIYFGNILGVEGFSDVSTTKCRKCKEDVQVQRRTLRASTLPKA
mmetsp:Transcript_10431/g.22638  ORF Transcript_10431/g.22638 Transcript_10431/m.22638 type:complete len:328 (-) Transcript_10431:62-1045(-)